MVTARWLFLEMGFLTIPTLGDDTGNQRLAAER